MKSIIFYFVAGVIIFLVAGKVKVSFRPLSIKFNDLTFAFAWISLLVSVILFQLSGYQKGRNVGYGEALDDVITEYKKDKLPH